MPVGETTFFVQTHVFSRYPFLIPSGCRPSWRGAASGETGVFGEETGYVHTADAPSCTTAHVVKHEWLTITQCALYNCWSSNWTYRLCKANKIMNYRNKMTSDYQYSICTWQWNWINYVNAQKNLIRDSFWPISVDSRLLSPSPLPHTSAAATDRHHRRLASSQTPAGKIQQHCNVWARGVQCGPKRSTIIQYAYLQVAGWWREWQCVGIVDHPRPGTTRQRQHFAITKHRVVDSCTFAQVLQTMGD